MILQQKKKINIIPYLDFCHCRETNIYLLPLLAFSVGFLLLETYTISKKKFTRPDLKICWFTVTWVCYFEYTRSVRNMFFFSFGDGKDRINPCLPIWFSSLSLISCVYFFCNVHSTIMNLTYFNSHNLQLADLHETSFPRLSLLPPSPWMGWMDGDHVLRPDLVQRHQIKII